MSGYNIIILLGYVGYWEIIYCNFLTFLNCKSFSQSKTLSASSIISNMIHFSVYSSTFNNFFFLNYLTNKHLAPSSELKIEQIFIILLCKFVFATFIKNVFNKISILGICESIPYCHTKNHDITIHRFFPPTPTNTSFYYRWNSAHSICQPPQSCSFLCNEWMLNLI